MWHAWEIREVCTGLWWGDPNEIHHLENLGINGSLIIKLMFKQWDEEARTALSGPG
jgi:hypothetical protein